MAASVYCVIPIHLSAKESANADVVGKRLEKRINEISGQGWDYVRLESVPVSVIPGCLGAMFGAKPQTIYLPQMVFKWSGEG